MELVNYSSDTVLEVHSSQKKLDDHIKGYIKKSWPERNGQAL